MLSDVLGVNDTDGDTIQAIRFENTGTDTLSYSLSKRACLDSNVSYDLPSLKDVYVRGHTSFDTLKRLSGSNCMMDTSGVNGPM